MKRCSKCHRKKRLSLFPLIRTGKYKGKKYPSCKACKNKKSYKWARSIGGRYHHCKNSAFQYNRKFR